MDSYDTIILEIEGHRATITLNRPDQLNGITNTMMRELYDCVRWVAAQEGIRAVKLTGSGRAFCVGADLKAYSSAEPQEKQRKEYYQITSILHEMPKVTVAAINGACAGAAIGWACACDLRYAKAGISFNTAFLDVALSGDMANPWLLPGIVGSAKARELCFLPVKFKAEDALRINLVTDVFPEKDFNSSVDMIVNQLAQSPPLALAGVKKNFIDAEKMALRDFIELETDRHLRTAQSADAREAFKAFVEKRPPVFKGR
jgi:2-(1,2-epoxy-1,2-dihydrophenyl)acetyl-CoA isomerase